MGHLLTISRGCHGAAILLADQRDGSEGCEPAGASAARPKGILSTGSVATAVPVRQWDRAITMGSIDKYIFRTTLASFAVVLVSLTGVIWITQALRGIDLMTSQGQTILTFLGITSLVIPALVLIIAPIALMT